MISGLERAGAALHDYRCRPRNRILLLTLTALVILTGMASYLVFMHLTKKLSFPPFVASIDTMKVSRDTIHHQLSAREITNIISLSASVYTNYITVDTEWDYPIYMQSWVKAIHATGNHVWFRIHPSQWENSNGSTGIMTPTAYEASEERFISSHPSFFQAGDILDPCPEPEQGHYWVVTYGPDWSYHAPNAATHAYNVFLRETTDVADKALHQLGIYGVITTVRSTNSFFPAHSRLLEDATLEKFGHITVDSYPEKDLRDPAAIVAARVEELTQIENLWHLPIIIGEMGYSNQMPVDDVTQQRVLRAEFDALVHLNYVVGLNYWVGAGSDTAGGYTYIFKRSSKNWIARPAVRELATFFRKERAVINKGEGMVLGVDYTNWCWMRVRIVASGDNAHGCSREVSTNQ